MTVFGGGFFGKWLGHEGGALLPSEFVLLQKSAERAPFAFSALWAHSKKMATYELGRGNQIYRQPGLGVSNLQNYKIEIPGFCKSPSIGNFIRAARTD